MKTARKGRGKWEVDIDFSCDSCGKPQPTNKEKSNHNWSVYDVGAKCECGGNYKMLISKRRNYENNGN